AGAGAAEGVHQPPASYGQPGGRVGAAHGAGADGWPAAGSGAEASERGELVPSLTQAEMAARLGTVREMIGRTLKNFEALGLIRLDRGQAAILDRRGLESQGEN